MKHSNGGPARRRPHRPAAFLRHAGLVGLAASLLAGCTLTPEPIPQAEHVARARQDRETLLTNAVPVTGPLSLGDAIARALKFNYDAQLTKTELSLQEHQLDLALMQMLPRLATSAGYNWRSNDNAASSVNVQTREQSLVPSFSEERDHVSGNIQFSWNALDLGVSYFQARQQGYRTFIAIERRRKVIQGIIKGVQEAYWKAIAAERLLPRLDPLLADAEAILEGSRQATRDRLQRPLQALDFQQTMLQIIGQLRRMRTDLGSAKTQLAALINVPLTVELPLASADGAFNPQRDGLDPRRLEELGLALRPELRQEAYQERVDRQDVYKEIVKMMPGVGLLAGFNGDSNKYMFNNTWGELGVRATFNLVSIIQGPKAIAAAETAVEISKGRRLALSVAVITQVNLSYQEYLSALNELDTTQQIDQVERQIAQVSAEANSASAQSAAEGVRRRLAAMAAELEYARANSLVHTALVNVYTAAGVDLVPPNADLEDLPTLSQHVRGAIADWEAGHLPSLAAMPVDVTQAGTPKPAQTSDTSR